VSIIPALTVEVINEGISPTPFTLENPIPGHEVVHEQLVVAGEGLKIIAFVAEPTQIV
jgi:hypothetical protein